DRATDPLSTFRRGRALPSRFEQREGGRDAHVQRLDPARERDREGPVTRPPHERTHALSLGAEDERDASGEIDAPERRLAVGCGRVGPEAVTLDLREVAGEVRHDRNRQSLDGTRRGGADGGRDDGCPVGREDDTGCAGARGTSDDGAEVPGIGDLVEAAEKRLRRSRKLPGIRIPEGLATRADAPK